MLLKTRYVGVSEMIKKNSGLWLLLGKQGTSPSYQNEDAMRRMRIGREVEKSYQSRRLGRSRLKEWWGNGRGPFEDKFCEVLVLCIFSRS